MDAIFWGLGGLLIGLVVGFLAAKAKAPGNNQSAIDLAAANATIGGLEAQLSQLRQEKLERDERDREENRLLQALAPVRSNLEQMQQTVARLEKDRVEQFGTIQQQLKAAVDSDEALRRQTQALAQALSSNSLRGVWGETQLRKLIELAGLIKHADFTEQVTFATDSGTGRADLVINLPGNKSLAIDSKVPFNSYQEAAAISELGSPEELARRQKLLEEHVKAVKSHIDALSGKAYWSGLSSSPDFVIAFVPSESLLSAALDADPTLLEYAFKKNVALASPVSLFSVLKTVNYIWRQNADESSVKNMIKLGKELYERVVKVAEHADKLGRSITATVKDYNVFVSSLESRMLVTARKLNDLDETGLATEEIVAPKEIETSPNQLTASELTENSKEA
ncbi:MAG: hypothetical protein RI933_460 [Actinomycetota bacterium]|jgi:DNA recombination protein RmuC